jgi:hypothetical protein
MGYGFSAVNSSGEIIVSDETENMHFVGKASRIGSPTEHAANWHTVGYGGAISGLDMNLEGWAEFDYTFNTAGNPVVFIRPSMYDRFHALVTQSNSGNTWSFKIMVSGPLNSTQVNVAASEPQLYIFVKANDAPPPGDGYGLVVYKSDGTTRTFDSRIAPLAIKNSGTGSSPSCPVNQGCPGVTSGHPWNHAVLDWDFRSGNGDKWNSYSISGTHTDLMFSATSIAQAAYKRQMEGYKCSDKPWPESGCQQHWSTAMWWVMYRQTFRLRSGAFDFGWTNYAIGYSFSSNYESGGWFGGGGGSYSSGTMPFTPQTINNFSSTYLIADATRYD